MSFSTIMVGQWEVYGHGKLFGNNPTTPND